MAVVNNLRMVLVWGFFQLPLGRFLCRVQAQFHYTALVGLVILMVGVAVYNDTWGRIRAGVKSQKATDADTEPEEERQEKAADNGAGGRTRRRWHSTWRYG